MESNRIKYPKAWAFYVEHARNIMDEPELNHLGNYRIPRPYKDENFIYADDVTELWYKFMCAWHEIRIDSPSVYGAIQHIVTHLNH